MEYILCHFKIWIGVAVTAGCPSTLPSISASFLKLRSCGYKNVIGAQEAKATVVGDGVREVIEEPWFFFLFCFFSKLHLHEFIGVTFINKII